MKNNMIAKTAVCLLAGIYASGVQALLISGDIIMAPITILNSLAVNDHQQGFNEQQGFTLLGDLDVDGGTDIAAGTVVDSHMIFLNRNGSIRIADLGVVWGFDGIILGVMSDTPGLLEGKSSGDLGAMGTLYPVITMASDFPNRGFESNDGYVISGNMLTVDMTVTEPGDWIRVITAHVSVPEPASVALLGLGLLGIAGMRRRQA